MLFLLLACTGESSAPTCTDADALAVGTISATVDGAEWTSAATWMWQGESLQITTDAADGWRFTFVAQTTSDGTTVKTAAAAALPVEVALTDAGGGWVLAYPDDGDSLSSDMGGGTLSISASDEATLQACFSFDAGNEASSLTVAGGTVNAEPF
jgi:hypothetical protein